MHFISDRIVELVGNCLYLGRIMRMSGSEEETYEWLNEWFDE